MTPTQSRRPSANSLSSDASDGDLDPAAYSSSSALILVHDPEDDIPFEFNSDDDNEAEWDTDSLSASSPPLSPSTIFIYLLSPHLKLGALLLPNTDLSLTFSLVSLVIFGLLSVFVRHIWYLLGRRMGRKADTEDAILDALARGRGKEGRRAALRSVVRTATISFRILLAAVYLRECVPTLCSTFSGTVVLTNPVAVAFLLSLFPIPFLAAQSIAWKRIVYSTLASVMTYTVWLVLVAVAHTTGTLQTSPAWSYKGVLWQEITIPAFAFASSGTLSLYASSRTNKPPNLAKTSKLRSFRTTSSATVAISALLMLPVALFSVYPHQAANYTVRLQPFISVLSSVTLMLCIPGVLLTTPSIPIPAQIRQRVPFSISKAVVYVAFFVISLLPLQWSGVINDVVLVSALLSTYFLPAFLHITTHYFNRPLSIVVPTSNTRTPSTPSASEHDELLLRKERALQKRQLKKRIIWDIGVWLLLIPCGGGFTWAVGRLVGKW